MLDIFDILGPIMVGPSSSHTAGAVRIGAMARTLLGAEPVRATISLHGSFAETGQGHGTDRALVAGLLGLQADDLKIPLSFQLAKKRGLIYSFEMVHLREAHPNTAILEVESSTGHQLKLQASSTGGGRIRVDKLDDIDVGFTGAFNTLIVHSQDSSGELADLTHGLSMGGVNIGNMSLHRSKRGGKVLMVIEVDQKVPATVRNFLEELRGIDSITYYEKDGK